MAGNTAELVREFVARASSTGLRIDVPPDGSLLSEIAVVGEAPGTREVEKRLPLVGGSGKFLWDVLRKYNVTRQHCFVTNVVKRQVSLSTENNERDAVNKGELQHWEGMLQWELSQLPNVKYILVLGNFALRALTQHTGIMNWRGSVIDTQINGRTVHLICTYNPAMVMREPKYETTFRFDIGKLQRVMDKTYKPYIIDHRINPSYREACQWIDKMQDEHIPVSFDIETMGGELACLGLANDNHIGMCINLRDRSSNRFSITEERSLLRKMQTMFANTDIQFIAQNGNFDAYFLWFKERIRVHRIWLDTLLAHHTLYPQLPHSLAYLTAQYTDHPFYKDDGKLWREGGNIDDYWRYNVKDVCITRAVADRELHELRQQNLDTFFFDHVMRIQPHLTQMTVLGIQCDEELKQQITIDLTDELHHKRESLIDKARIALDDPEYDFNPNSTKQKAELFFKKLRLVGHRGTSTNKENRERMLAHPRNSEEAKAVLRGIDDYAEDHKFLSTYAEMRLDEDGRIRCEWKQYGTQKAPGRLSSSQTLWGSGMNMQNQPERSQPMFVADEGYAFSYFDLSQAEARLVAYQAQVKALIENFVLAGSEGLDVHRANAARIFKCSYDDIPKEDRTPDGGVTRRFLGKRCVHGLNYRMGPDRLATTCGIPLAQAMDAYYAYHNAFPEIKTWWDEVIREVHRTRMLYNAYGRRLYIMQRLDDAALESIVAFYPQSTIGDKVSGAIAKCHEDPDWPRLRNGQLRARVVLNIHDALIALHRDNHGEAVRVVMKKHLEEPVMVRGEPVIIPAEAKASRPDDTGRHRWSTLQKV